METLLFQAEQLWTENPGAVIIAVPICLGILGLIGKALGLTALVSFLDVFDD